MPFDTNFDIQCINMVYNDPSGKYSYFGTYGNGLFIYDNHTKQVTRYYDENCGLISNNIYSIVPDRNGNLYLGTENGLSFSTSRPIHLPTGPKNRDYWLPASIPTQRYVHATVT